MIHKNTNTYSVMLDRLVLEGLLQMRARVTIVFPRLMLVIDVSHIFKEIDVPHLICKNHARIVEDATYFLPVFSIT